MSTSRKVLESIDQVNKEIANLCFAPPVTHVYNPLIYAGDVHREYIETYATGPKKVVFLGMNPGPFGMAQTGVPFGEVSAVRDWLALGEEAEIIAPPNEHEKRPIEGFDCKRSEVSGKRLWDFFKKKYKTPKAFFKDHYVMNYCPLVFMEEEGKNRTPDKLPVEERQELEEVCDRHLLAHLRALKPTWLVGVGGYAEKRALKLLETTRMKTKVTSILHPSPASPAANKGWEAEARKQLKAAKVWR